MTERHPSNPAKLPDGSDERTGKANGVKASSRSLFGGRKRLLKTLLLLGVLVAAVAVVLHLSYVFIPLGIALLIAYILEPILSWFETHRANRGLTVSGVYVLLLMGLLGLGILIGPVLVSQTRGLIRFVQDKLAQHDISWEAFVHFPPGDGEVQTAADGGDAPSRFLFPTNNGADDESPSAEGGTAEEAGSGRPLIDRSGRSIWDVIRQQARSLSRDIPSHAMNLARAVLSGAGVVAGYTAQTVLVLFYAFFFMLHFPDIKRAVFRWIPDSHATEIHDVLGDMDDAVASFFRGRLMVCMISAVVASTGLLVSGIRYWLVLGIASGLLGIVPVFGVVVTLVPSAILGLVSRTPVYSTAGVLVTFAVVQWVIEPLVGSFVISKNVQLHPVTIIAALLAGGILFGLIGIVIAIPLTAILKILANRYLGPTVREAFGWTGSS